MADKAWKAAERRVARYIGGERVPVTGRQRGDAPDIQHDHLAVEVKYRNGLPSWIKEAMSQAEACNPGDKLPVVILIEKGSQIGDAYIQMRLSEFVDRFGR